MLTETIQAVERRVHPGLPEATFGVLTRSQERAAAESKDDEEDCIIIRIQPSTDLSIRQFYKIKTEPETEELDAPSLPLPTPAQPAPSTSTSSAQVSSTQEESDPDDDEEDQDLSTWDEIDKTKVQAALEQMKTATETHLGALESVQEAIPSMSDQSVRATMAQVPHLSKLPVNVEQLFEEYGSENFRLMLAAGWVTYERFRKNVEADYKAQTQTYVANFLNVPRKQVLEVIKGERYKGGPPPQTRAQKRKAEAAHSSGSKATKTDDKPP